MRGELKKVYNYMGQMPPIESVGPCRRDLYKRDLYNHKGVPMVDLFHASVGVRNGLSSYELSLFFTIFVMLQFWNMFNARAYATGRSALHFAGCSGFVLIACIMHDTETIIPDGQSRFEKGDTVVVVAPSDAGLEQFNDIFV